MTNDEPVTDTLPTGEPVTEYPDGRKILVPTNPLAERLKARQPELQAASDAKVEALVAAADEKRRRQDDGDIVPCDKRVV